MTDILVSAKTKELMQKYNDLIDQTIANLQALKLEPININVPNLHSIKNKFSCLTSSSNRKRIETAFQEMYDNYTYEIEQVVRREEAKKKKGTKGEKEAP